MRTRNEKAVDLAAGLLALLHGSLAAPARADVLWSPRDDRFFEQHYDQCDYIGRQYCANGDQGFVTLWDAPWRHPGGPPVLRTATPSGSTTSMRTGPAPWSGGTRGRSAGWAPLADFALKYDDLSFAEEYAEEIRPYGGQFDDYSGSPAEVVFYSYPGAPESKDVREAAWALDELTGQAGDSYIQSIFVDEDGRTWGYVGYLYGRINGWFCLDEPGGTDFPVREVEVPELIPAQAPRLPAMAYVPYALVAAVVIVTAVLLAVFFRKKRGR